MNDIIDDIEFDEEEKKKKSDEEEGEEGATSASEVPAISEQAFALMFQIGLSKERITEMLNNWRHFKNEGLIKRISYFMQNLIKSKHIEVQIDKEKNFNVVHDLIQENKNKEDIDPHAVHPHKVPHKQNMPKPQ